MFLPLLRTFFLLCAKSKYAERTAKNVAFLREISMRFVAGETRRYAVFVAENLRKNGLEATIDYLGEEALGYEEVETSVVEYLRLIDYISQKVPTATVSVKLTSIGLTLDEKLCWKNFCRIANRACMYGTMLEIDMEGSAYTKKTISLYLRFVNQFPFIFARLAFQGYLRSALTYTEKSYTKKLLRYKNTAIRLVKGAYDESNEIVIKDSSDLQKQCIEIMELFLSTDLSTDSLNRGARLALGSHDPVLIEWLKEEMENRALPKDVCEFQMLYGVRSDEQERLAKEGYTVRVYVPYGEKWFPYFMRRMAERPANVWFVIRAIFS